MDNKDKNVAASKELVKARNKAVHMITQRLESFSLNTVISGFMETTNNLLALAKSEGGVDKDTLKDLVLMIAPFAPHIGEELWEALGEKDSVFHHPWPTWDEEKMKDDEIQVPVQVNGKMRAVVTISAEASKEEALEAGKAAVAGKISGNIIKEIYVPKKIINIVVKPQ